MVRKWFECSGFIAISRCDVRSRFTSTVTSLMCTYTYILTHNIVPVCVMWKYTVVHKPGGYVDMIDVLNRQNTINSFRKMATSVYWHTLMMLINVLLGLGMCRLLQNITTIYWYYLKFSVLLRAVEGQSR